LEFTNIGSPIPEFDLIRPKMETTGPTVRNKALGAKKHVFPQGAFVKMSYFAIEERERVGYTLAALRCGRKRSVTT